MPEVLLIIPGIPRAKGSRSIRRYEQRVREIALRHFDQPLRQQDLSMEIHHFYTRGNLLDIDNLQKPILDGLKGAAYDDDGQIDRITAQRYNLSGSYVVEDVREEWADWLELGGDFVSVLIRF